MKRKEIIDTILKSEILSKWHWFGYHFRFYTRGLEHPFARSIVDTLYHIGKHIDNLDSIFIKKIAELSGKEKDLKHYEQLMQILAELLIIHKSVTFKWNNLEKFEYEPKVKSISKKNPELNIHTGDIILGIEVKSPDLIDHQKKRIKNQFQLVSRNPLIESLPKDATTYPRDNPVKDFLISANEKFKPFKKEYNNYVSVLFIVWDDYINEPISALIAKPKGLFMEDSFAKDSKGNNLKFENVDYVMISRHRFQFQQLAGDIPFPYFVNHPMDYGTDDQFPFKVIIKNPNTADNISKEAVECFQTYAPSYKLGAEYTPTDFVSYL